MMSGEALVASFTPIKYRVTRSSFSGVIMSPGIDLNNCSEVEGLVFSIQSLSITVQARKGWFTSELAFRSNIAFFTAELLVDGYGNVYPWDSVIYGGEMSKLHLGDELPRDYEP